MKIGFIGLGHMGNPMVCNLLKAGHEVTVYDVVPEAVSALKKEGARVANRLQDINEGADIVFTMLQSGEQVHAVCLNEEGIFKTLSKKALYIDSSSIDVGMSRKIHEEAARQGLAMLDAPVSGGVAGAKAATLTFMVGGEINYFERAKPILEKLGKNIIYAGAAGNGQAAKICNNMILGISMIAVSEGFTLAQQLGLDPKTFFDITRNASGQCWVINNYLPIPGILPSVPANNDYQPGFAVKMMLKDLYLSQEAAKNVGATTPLGAEATALFALFAHQGNGEKDFSAIVKLFEG